MRDADRRLLLRVRTQVARFLDTMARVLQDSDPGIAGMITVCSTTVQAGAIPDEDLAGALHLALVPHRAAVALAADSGAAEREAREAEAAFVEALVDVAISPLETQLHMDGSVVRSFCADPGNRESLIKWASKLLRATEAALASARARTETETTTRG